MKASERRLTHAKNRLAWQKRFLERTTDPLARRIAEKMLIVQQEIIETLEDTHRLLLRIERQRRDEPD